MKEIGIGIFYHNENRNYLPTLIRILDRMEEENKKNCKLYILSTNKRNFKIDTDIETEICVFNHTGNNYRNKLLHLINMSHKYSMTLSEDFLTSNYVFDYLIDNRELLDNQYIAHLTGITQIGVPSVEHFLNLFCTPDEKEIVHQLFLKTDMSFVAEKWNIPEISTLNKHTLQTEKWSYKNFHADLQKLNTIFKGIHPVRFNYKAQIFLSEIVINNIDKFMQKHKYEIFTDDICHHCNDMSFHLNNTLKTVEEKYKLDPDEEVALSRYKRDFGLNFNFIKYGYVYTELFSFNYYQIPAQKLDSKRKEIEVRLTQKINNYLDNN